MQPDLSCKPYVELQDMTDRALSGGASPEFAVKHLVSSGVAEDTARKLVGESVERLRQQRALAEEDARSQYKTRLVIALLWIVMGCAFIGVSLLAKLTYTAVIGLWMIAVGVRRLWIMHSR
ncbi:MAG: hypothetical protein NTW87_19315 [Planctomycetota bacterium]|nr:hypothetical protein [Planctomycetota bacterium]